MAPHTLIRRRVRSDSAPQRAILSGNKRVNSWVNGLNSHSSLRWRIQRAAGTSSGARLTHNGSNHF